MNSIRKGFTLIELLVVVLILGVLASIGAPQYMKTVETSKATDAVGLVQMLANAQRMCIVDNGAASCGSRTNLITRKYMADHDWNGAPYNYQTCPGGTCCGGSAVACAVRKSGTYAGWGYRISDSGVCSQLTATTPRCPGM
jgi:prepilin-type N-terminal cleavage/methylation domain-containing protein